jgi:hypothetical protein
MMDKAFHLWVDKGVDLAMVAEEDAKGVKQRIDFEIDPDKFKAWGNTHKEFYGNALTYALITVQDCNVYLIAHEMGHAVGFGHSDDPDNLMFPDVGEFTGEIPDTQVETLQIARDSGK